MTLSFSTQSSFDNAQVDHDPTYVEGLWQHESESTQDFGTADSIQAGYPFAFPNFSANLVHYYPLTESSGATTAYDMVSATDGSYTGAIVADRGGFAGYNVPYFDGTDDYVDCGQNLTNDMIANNNSFAICCWARHDGTSWNTSYENIVNDYDGTGAIALQRDNGNAQLAVYIDSDPFARVSDDVFLDNDFHFIYAHLDASAGEALTRVDDTTATESTTNVPSTISANHWIGAQPSNSNFWKGHIHHLMAFDGPLTTTEQEILLNTGY